MDRYVWECERIRYLLLLSAAPSVRLVQQPCAEDWVHVDSYALDTDQQDCTWTTQTHMQSFNSATLKMKTITAMIYEQFSQKFPKTKARGYTVHLSCLYKIKSTASKHIPVVWKHSSCGLTMLNVINTTNTIGSRSRDEQCDWLKWKLCELTYTKCSAVAAIVSCKVGGTSIRITEIIVR